mmetsp:Transcript_49810/g.106440  ORF Transcript_49810/g.106440 Transcript_49810/m.106440 type:complete len:272 (-) Transcript_49810:1701-2516(-)
MLKSIFVRTSIGFWPCIELATLNSCVSFPELLGGTTLPLAGLICSFIYLGTATWKLSAAMGVGKLLVNDASMAVTLWLLGSLLHAKVTSSPCLLKAVNGALPPGAGAGAGAGAPSIIAGPPIIAAIASMPAGAAGGGAGAVGPDPRRSISIESMPPAPGGGAAGGAAAVGVAGGGAGAADPRISESRSISGAGAGCTGVAVGSGMDAAAVGTGAALLDTSSLPSPVGCAGVRSFFVKAGMRSSTPARMLSSRRRLVYSTERCCSSSDIEPE